MARAARLVVAVLCVQAVFAGSELDRLVTLGKLWFNIQYFHPQLAYRNIDWDGALIRAIPKVRDAKTGQEYVSAVQSMLGELGDPATRVVPPGAAIAAGPHESWFRTQRKGDIALLTLVPLGPENYATLRRQLPELQGTIIDTKRVVFDLRVKPGMESDARFVAGVLSNEAGFWNLLIDRPVRQPGVRYRTHDAYQTGLEYSEARLVEPIDPPTRRPAVFIVNRYSPLPPMAAALQSAGQAIVIFAGEGVPAAPGSAKAVRLEDGWRAEYRADEVILENGSGILQPTLRASDERAVETALAQPLKPARSAAAASPLPLLPNPRTAAFQDRDRYPSGELRLLSAFRIWGIIHYFFAYKDLMEEDWELVLRRFIPRFLGAKNEGEYHLAAAEMVATLHDSHAGVSSPFLTEFFGVAAPPVQLQMIEGKPVVTRIVGEAPGLRLGDAVVSVDGQEASACFSRIARFVAASTPQARCETVMRRFLCGPDRSSVLLVVEGERGGTREVRLTRSLASQAKLVKRRGGEVIKMMPGNIGYVDLDRLQVEEVDGMFEAMRETKAIIFDMRGYPNGTAWSIAPRLTEKLNVTAALVKRRIWFEPDGFDLGETNGHMIYQFQQRLPETQKWRYRGKIVTLIDERAVSQAEHTCLFLEAAASATFIGSPTAGADGDVASFLIPGGARVTYTGHDVRHADGRRLQRVGIQPHILVEPTIAGIRTGSDEVLERAAAYLNER